MELETGLTQTIVGDDYQQHELVRAHREQSDCRIGTTLTKFQIRYNQRGGHGPRSIKRLPGGSGLRSHLRSATLLAFLMGQARHPQRQRSSKLLTASIHALPELRYNNLRDLVQLVWS